MSVTVLIELSNASGFPGGISGFDPSAGGLFIPDVYQPNIFSVDVKFYGEYEIPGEVDPGTGETGDPTYVYADATDHTSTFDWGSYGLTYTKLGTVGNRHTFRLVGPWQNVFPSETFLYALETPAGLPPATPVLEYRGSNYNEKPFHSLVQYTMPSPQFEMKAMPFSVNLPAAGVDSASVQGVTVSQTVYWNFDAAAANIASVISRGTK
jgi:hypothetical protein